MTPKQKRARISTFLSKTLASSSLSNSGTTECLVETASPVVIGADTLLTSTASEPSAKETVPNKVVLTDLDYQRLPRFTIRSAGCCGLMEVSGIEGCMIHTLELSPRLRDVALGLYVSLKYQQEHFLKLTKMYNQAAINMERAHSEETRSLFREAAHRRDMHLHTLKHGLAGQFIFTYRTRCGNVFFLAFKEYIENKELGSVFIAPEDFFNPNSNNQVQTVLWNVHQKNYRAFLKEHLTDTQYDFPLE